MATQRLRKELIKLRTEPPPGVIAEPDESNILKWYYVVRGPTETPYEGGIYLGKLIFPKEYPMKAPSIYMLTPSGRFAINEKICMSMSDFHPESWNPMWSVATIIQGIQSFMVSDELTTGGLRASEADRKKFAELSLAYTQKTYPKLFDGDIVATLEAADQVCKKAEEEKGKASASGQDAKASTSRRSRRMARKAASNQQQEESQHDADKESENNANDEEEKYKETDAVTKELTPEEIEKRRKKNAKKRAKQKAKKAAAKSGDGEEE